MGRSGELRTKKRNDPVVMERGELSRLTKRPLTTCAQAQSRQLRRGTQQTRGNKVSEPTPRAERARVNVTVESEFDRNRFVSLEAQRVYNTVMVHEILADSRVFDFQSLNACGLRLEEDFKQFGIAKFVSECSDVYVDLVRQFYANLTKWEGDDEFEAELGDKELKSLVNGTEIKISKDLLYELFDLIHRGYVCRGKETYKDEFGDTFHLDVERTKDWMKENFKVVDIEAGIFDQNDFGVKWRMVHLAFTKCLQPKNHTQSPFTNQDLEIMHWLMKKRRVNFAHVVLEWMEKRATTMHSPAYAKKDRQRKEDMPFGSVLTKIFQHFGVSFEGYEATKVPISKRVRRESLKNMKIYRTKNRGYVFWPYLRDEDEMFYPEDKNKKPSREEQIFVRKESVPPKKIKSGKEVPESTQTVPTRESRDTNSRLDKMENEIKDLKYLMILNFKTIESMRTGKPISEIEDPIFPSTVDIGGSSQPSPPPLADPTPSATERQVAEDLAMIDETVRQLQEEGLGGHDLSSDGKDGDDASGDAISDEDRDSDVDGDSDGDGSSGDVVEISSYAIASYCPST